MTTKVQKWGNSLAVRLPKELADKLGITEGSAVTFKAEKRDLRIVPKKKETLSLAELVKNITNENRHTETQWGNAVGNEVW